MNIEAILESNLGAVVAPAGCGKTHLITEALSIKAKKPILVLTHTTAGVSALKSRLRRLSVPASNYVVTTIDGWSLRMANSFPSSCPITISPDNPRQFYPELRRVVFGALNSGAFHEIIKASYSRLLVDEYQDCDNNQHNIIVSLSKVLPTVIFGDPMQCIFSFAGPMPNWEQEVQREFPLLGTLNTPWRWNNAGAPEFGEWILAARDKLLREERLDLTNCPNHVLWNQLTGNVETDLVNRNNAQQRIINQNQADSFLVIGSSMNERSRHQYAQTSRSIQVVEQVQLSQVINAAEEFDRLRGINLVESILTTVSTMATNIEMARTLTRVNSILGGRNRQPPTPFEYALSNVAANNHRSDILMAIQEAERKDGARLYRRNAYIALKDTVSLSVSSPDKTMAESAMVIREQIRQRGDSRIPKRAIGSTLLLKGLEADHCLVLDANDRGMDRKHLYVALSRGAKTVTVFSRNGFIN